MEKQIGNAKIESRGETSEMANDLILIRPSKLLEKEILMYKQEHFSYGDNQVHGTCGLAYYDNFD